MGEARVLSASDRDFFRRIGQIAFSNPFSDDRAQRVRELAGDAMRSGMADSEALNAVIGRRLQALDAEGRIELRRLAADDASCLKPALLFDVYHRHLRSLDALIERQASRRETRVDAPLADRLLGELVPRFRRGRSGAMRRAVSSIAPGVLLHRGRVGGRKPVDETVAPRAVEQRLHS